MLSSQSWTELIDFSLLKAPLVQGPNAPARIELTHGTSRHHSTSGMVFMFASGAISWRTKKQTTVALSSTEAEYVAATLAVKEGLWLKSILIKLDVIKLSHTKCIVTINLVSRLP